MPTSLLDRHLSAVETLLEHAHDHLDTANTLLGANGVALKERHAILELLNVLAVARQEISNERERWEPPFTV